MFDENLVQFCQQGGVELFFQLVGLWHKDVNLISLVKFVKAKLPGTYVNNNCYKMASSQKVKFVTG